MPGLTISQLKTFNRSVRDLYAAARDGRFLDSLPGIVQACVGGDICVSHYFAPRDQHGEIWNSPAFPHRPRLMRNFFAAAHEHPCLGRRHVAGSVSDKLSRHAWHRTTLYSEVFRELGVQDDLGFDARLDDGARLTVASLRRRWTSRSTDRLMLDLVGTHLRPAHRIFERVKRGLVAPGMLTEALERTVGHGLVRLDARGRVLECTATTTAMLEKFAGRFGRRGYLPTSLLSWFRDELRRELESEYGEVAPKTLRFDLGDESLMVEFAGDSKLDRYFLVLETSSPTPHAGLLRPLGLTRREQDVLFWVAQGKSNQAVATILGISPSTVKRHLENIYAHLEVDGRHAATMCARVQFPGG
jgi:DNA-binding CsgD family transcriptional regulator